jgi:dTDP-4-dehydrorhamnose 3,5-epimerase
MSDSLEFMPFEESPLKGVYIHTATRIKDTRGFFEEQFKLSDLQNELGIDFLVKQVNQSSSSKGVLRGIHFTEGIPGQAKYVSCLSGSIWDVVVDLRRDSPSYGTWFADVVSAENGHSVYIPTGCGHAFLALEEDSVVNYLCSAEYDAVRDRTLNPLSSTLAIPFEEVMDRHDIQNFILSEKDASAPDFQAK